MKVCSICEKLILNIFNDNQYILRKITPLVLKNYLFQKGRRYKSNFYLCYDCMHGSDTRLKMKLKNMHCLIKRDFIYFKGGDVKIKDYWFTLEIKFYGYECVYDKKTKTIVSEKIEKSSKFMAKEHKLFLDSIIEEIWELIDYPINIIETS